MKKKTSVAKAVNTLTKSLKKDPGFYYAYQSNIAMQFYDEARRKKVKVSRAVLLDIANTAAKNFLDLLISSK